MKLPLLFKDLRERKNVTYIDDRSRWPGQMIIRAALFSCAFVCSPFIWAESVTGIADSYSVQSPRQNQKGEIKGRVVDANGDPLAGVTIRMKNYNGGYITNANGEFTIQTKRKEEHLIFTFIGFKKKEMTVKSGQKLKVVLDEDVNTLGDVVVTGFISKNKNSYTGSQTTIQGDQLLSVGTRNALESI